MRCGFLSVAAMAKASWARVSKQAMYFWASFVEGPKGSWASASHTPQFQRMYLRPNRIGSGGFPVALANLQSRLAEGLEFGFRPEAAENPVCTLS